MMRSILPKIVFFTALLGTVAPADAQTYELLYGFTGGTADGASPVSPLIQASDGYFYGTTEYGGAYSCGTVYRTDGTSALTILHSFRRNIDGCNPTAALLEASGLFYGVARVGGALGDGTLFQMDANGVLTVLHNFQSGGFADNGAFPYSAVIQASDGSFYGTTPGGGEHWHGTVYRWDANEGFTVRHAFDASGGGGFEPYASLIQATDGSFYGTTAFGGNPNGDCEDCDRIPGGTVFRMDTSGAITYLFNFDVGGGNGDTPVGGLVQTGPTTFYGTTSNLMGFSSGLAFPGTVFQIDTSAESGGLYTLHQFDPSPGFPGGAFPVAALIQATDGNMYGTALAGGQSGHGVVFELNAASEATVLHSFDGDPADGDGGGEPGAALVQGADGHLYGTAAANSNFWESSGGPGTLFRLNILDEDKTDQTITFAALADKTFGDQDFVVAATASSSLEVRFTATGACSVTGASVHLTGAGTCTVSASQAGDDNYNAAPDVPRSFAIAKGTANMEIGNFIQAYDGTPKSVTVTTTPTILSGVSVTYDGSPTAPTSPGIYIAFASLDNPDYQAYDQARYFVITSSSGLTLSLSSASVNGGTSLTGTVTLASPAPVGGAVVNLVSLLKDTGIVQDTVVIARGKTSKTFTIATSPVASATAVGIAATYESTAGISTAVAQFTVRPTVLTKLTLNPKGVAGGASSTAVVTLSGPAPWDGLLVTLTSSNPLVASVTNITVPAGALSGSAPITTSQVASTTSVTITAISGGVSTSGTLTVRK